MGMTTSAVGNLVIALYLHHKRWQKVADACNGTTLHHSAGYYQGISGGQTKNPHRAALSAIYREARKLPGITTAALKLPREPEKRKTVHLYPSDHTSGNLERGCLGLTWPEMVHLWHSAYVDSVQRSRTSDK